MRKNLYNSFSCEYTMPTPQLQRWIEHQMAAGMPRQQIKDTLMAQGWKEGQVEQALNLMGTHDEPGKHQQQLPEHEEKDHSLRFALMVLLGVTFLAVGLVMVVVWFLMM